MYKGEPNKCTLCGTVPSTTEIINTKTKEVVILLCKKCNEQESTFSALCKAEQKGIKL